MKVWVPIAFAWGMIFGVFCCGLYWHSQDAIVGSCTCAAVLGAITIAVEQESNKS